MDLIRSLPVGAARSSSATGPVPSSLGTPVLAPLRRLSFEPVGCRGSSVPVDLQVEPPGWVPCAWMRTAPARIQVANRVGELAALIETIAAWWPLVWDEVADPGEATASRVSAARAWRLGLGGDLLVVRGFRQGTPRVVYDELHDLRRRVTDSATWELLPGQPSSSLVATIDRGTVAPEDLLLRMRPRPVLRTWPGAATALPMLWAVLRRVGQVVPGHPEGQ
jgi:hypothetical protein